MEYQMITWKVPQGGVSKNKRDKLKPFKDIDIEFKVNGSKQVTDYVSIKVGHVKSRVKSNITNRDLQTKPGKSIKGIEKDYAKRDRGVLYTLCQFY